MKRETIQTKYQDMDVEYDVRRETWTVKVDEANTLGETAVKAINPELYAGIKRHMEREVAEYQTRKDREEAERKAKEEAERTTRLAEWRDTVGNTLAAMNTDIGWRVDEIGEVVLDRGDRLTATVCHSDRVYRSGSFRSGSTELCWMVRLDYRSKRFKTLEQAIKNVDKHFAEKIELAAVQADNETARTVKVNAVIEELAKDGLAGKEETRYVRNLHGRGHSTELKEVIARKGHLIGRAAQDADGLRIDGTRIVCRLTAGQFARLAEILESNEFTTL